MDQRSRGMLERYLKDEISVMEIISFWEEERDINKRYSEALEEIYENWTTSSDVISGDTLAYTSKELARKALEDSE